MTGRALLLAALLVAAAILLGAWSLLAGRRDRAGMAVGNAAMLQAEALLSAMRDVETGQRGFVLTGNDAFLEPYANGLAAAARQLAAIEAEGPGSGLDPTRLRELVRARQDYAARVVALRREGGLEAARLAVEEGRGKEVMDALRTETAQAQAAITQRVEALRQQDDRRTAWCFALGALLIVAAGAVLGAYALARRRAERRAAALLDSVMENAPVGLGLLDRDLRLHQANRALAEMSERTLGLEAGRQDLRSALPAEVLAAVEPRLREVLEGGKAQSEVEVTLRPAGRPNAAPRQLLMAFFPLREDGLGAGLVVTDVSIRRRYEERLRRSEGRLRTLVDSIPQLAWMTDAEGSVQWYNRRWYEYTGTTPEEMQGDGWVKVHSPDHVERVVAHFRAAIAAGEPWEDTFPIRGADGRYRWFLSRALPLRDEPDEASSEGRLVGWFGTNTDITEMRAAEEELAAARDAAEDANKAKSQFIANMSHELRTPLSAVIGYSEMLEEQVEDLGDEGAEILDDLRKIGSNARHLLSLINDVLDLSKIEAGKMEVQAEDFPLEPLLHEVGDTVEALIGRKHNRLVLELAPGLGEMHSDTVKLRQCLFNLLSNAAKFTEGGQITLAASRQQRDGRDWLELRVADTGIGMTEEQLQRLFQRFSQADASTTRRFGGTGLGLAITKAFCTMLGGDIAVESQAGAGTTFTIQLPADLREARADPGEPEAAAEELPGPPSAEEGSAGLVLVVDDDAAARDLLARFLRREGFAVRTAQDGAAGLRLAREMRPNAILLDVMMPRMDGWAVLSALKAEPALAETPVIMVTVVQERGLAFSLGAADYLTKPVQWPRLKAALDRARTATTAGAALVLEHDAVQRLELRQLLEAEGWTVREAATSVAALRLLESGGGAAVPDLVLVGVPGFEGDGIALIQNLRRHPEWRELPVIALAEGKMSDAERDGLRGQVRRVLPMGEEPPEGLLAELQRIANQSQPAARIAGPGPMEKAT
ncbi:response regulator [Belnapia sp. T6]|uniref:histidine kinase n=1 Tax=Belnapia mucosa TaxID=2804532 RepID=A0ABS1V3Y6_9PROT|nr:response regulator [Belnapia mucosa]MBL6456400.1 response regulator [Belnapia mucosa]